MIKITLSADKVGDWMFKNNIGFYLLHQLKEFNPQKIETEKGDTIITIPDLDHEVVDCGDVTEEGYQPSIIISKPKETE